MSNVLAIDLERRAEKDGDAVGGLRALSLLFLRTNSGMDAVRLGGNGGRVAGAFLSIEFFFL